MSVVSFADSCLARPKDQRDISLALAQGERGPLKGITAFTTFRLSPVSLLSVKTNSDRRAYGRARGSYFRFMCGFFFDRLASGGTLKMETVIFIA